MWIHINFWFKRPNKIHRTKYYLTPIQQIEFHKLISKICKFPLIKRKFFLYEPNPHCFLAIEINKWLVKLFIDMVKNMLMKETPKFIIGIDFASDTNDTGKKGEAEIFVDCLNAFTKVTLSSNTIFSPSWYKKFPIKHKNIGITGHIIHCCLNQITNSRLLEKKFYQEMNKFYKTK